MTRRAMPAVGMQTGLAVMSRLRMAAQMAGALLLGLPLPSVLILSSLTVWELANLIAAFAWARPATVTPLLAPIGSAEVPHQPTVGVRPSAPSQPGRPLRSHDPTVIGDYQLLSRIGVGGMGTVYQARRLGSATVVALKTLNPEFVDDPELLRRFEREAVALARVPSAFTTRVLDTGVSAGLPFLVMELLDDRPLDVHLRDFGPIRSGEALRSLALALALALEGVHSCGLVHRDLKPANIMLTSAGPKLLDFGIATIVDATRLTRAGGIGTLTYMAPEQFGDDPIGPAADIWVWACCIICAAHGTSPFTAPNTGAVINRILDLGPDTDSLATVYGLDPGLARIVRQGFGPVRSPL